MLLVTTVHLCLIFRDNGWLYPNPNTKSWKTNYPCNNQLFNTKIHADKRMLPFSNGKSVIWKVVWKELAQFFKWIILHLKQDLSFLRSRIPVSIQVKLPVGDSRCQTQCSIGNAACELVLAFYGLKLPKVLWLDNGMSERGTDKLNYCYNKILYHFAQRCMWCISMDCLQMKLNMCVLSQITKYS